MNQMSSDATGAITGAHLALIVILAIAAILVIWWGRRLRRRQRETERQVEVRREATGEAPAAAEVPSVARTPVTPSPPPLVDLPAEPAPVAAPQTTSAEVIAPTPAAGHADAPVTLLKGLGPKVAARLGELGITTVGQLAALTPAEAEALDADLGTFKGRMTRDRWIEQAKLLAAGDRAGFEATFGKLG